MTFQAIVTNPQIITANTPFLFTATTTSSYDQSYHSTPFLFASLGGYTTQSAVRSTAVQPVIFPTAATSQTTLNSVVFKPTPTTAVPAIPSSTTHVTSTTQSTLISQLIKQPIVITDQPQTCGLNRGTTNRVVGGSEARKGSIC